jgi:hypothetical protein
MRAMLIALTFPIALFMISCDEDDDEKKTACCGEGPDAVCQFDGNDGWCYLYECRTQTLSYCPMQ